MQVVIRFCTHEEDSVGWVSETAEQAPDVIAGVETVLVSCEDAECEEGED